MSGEGSRVFALLGDPVAHSLSPAIHEAAMRDLGLEGRYVTRACRSDEVEAVARRFARAGGGGNVTLPHKERVAGALDRPTRTVRLTGACNTFWWDGGLAGDNTDVQGFTEAQVALTGGPPSGARVLVLGAGGAAAAVLVALLDGGATEIRLHNRTRERAERLRRRMGVRAERIGLVETLDAELLTPFDLVVNATRLGLHPEDPLPFDPERLEGTGALLDLAYGSVGVTRLVERARSHGVRAADGAEMLVRQAAAAFQRWWGRRPSLPVMREALAAARTADA